MMLLSDGPRAKLSGVALTITPDGFLRDGFLELHDAGAAIELRDGPDLGPTA